MDSSSRLLNCLRATRKFSTIFSKCAKQASKQSASRTSSSSFTTSSSFQSWFQRPATSCPFSTKSVSSLFTKAATVTAAAGIAYVSMDSVQCAAAASFSSSASSSSASSSSTSSVSSAGDDESNSSSFNPLESAKNVFHNMFGGNGDSTKDANEESILDVFTQAPKWITVGGVFGYCAGTAARKFTDVVAIYAGVAFICLQGLQYYGYVKVDYDKVVKDGKQMIDQDGDNEFTTADMKVWLSKGFQILKNGLPSTAGFTVGFYYGFRG